MPDDTNHEIEPDREDLETELDLEDLETEPEKPAPRRPTELTPEEREQLRKKIEQAKKDDPNIYPVF